MSANRLKRKRRPIPDVLTRGEQARLLLAMPSGSLLQRRNLAMVRLMLNAGLRSQEVCDLRVADIHWPSGKLKVRGKGGRQRIVWLTDEDRDLLREYFKEAAPSGVLFQTGLGNKIETRFLRCLVARLGERAGLAKKLHPHLLRHTFATDFLRETKNLRMVQVALGHENLSTTQIYTHIVNEELESAMKNFRARR